jgi:peptidoglycan/LPS O-acetylase OafA/YrhL
MKHNLFIDNLRGVSILAVIFLHLRIHIPFENHIPQWLFNIIFGSGYYGVIIFFVISGFLITSTIFRRWGDLNNINYKDFYRMRFARIMPCLLALIIILSLFDLLAIPGFVIQTTSLSNAIFAALTFHINWLEAKTGYLPASWDVLWSLAIEEVFYLFYPLICLISGKKWLFFGIMLLFILAGPFARTLPHNDMWQDHGYLSCMDGIAFGVLAAVLTIKKPFNYNQTLFIIVGSGLFIVAFFFRHVVALLGLTTVGLNVTVLEFSVALLLVAFSAQTQPIKKLSILGWYGRSSYEIYLTHMFIIVFFSNVLRGYISVWVSYSLAIVLSGLVGGFVAHYYSEPLNRRIRGA